MDPQTLTAARRGLHAVAERLVAGPQYREQDEMRLAVTPGGFAGVRGGWRVEGTDLVGEAARVPLTGTLAEVAARAGIEPGGLETAYGEHADWPDDEPLALDPAAAATLLAWFALGDAALRAFAPDEQPVLWPEHFDLGIVSGEVNYGVSPGDTEHPSAYAYVGPWTPRSGPFWNAPFGARRAATDFPDAPALTGFFTAGHAAAT